MRALRVFAAAALCVAVTPALAAPELVARWVQYDATGAAQARLIVDGDACPALTVDGASVATLQRAAPDASFPYRICTAGIAAGSRSVAALGQILAAPAATPGRIIVLGDTGCRVQGKTIQACSDPAAWPFARVAERAASLHPDLVIHVGDYLYRETPCPAGDARCAGSPSGDNWASWRADFFAPGESLLAAAPWVVVRGNHEECARAGRGWTRLLGAAPDDPGAPCAANEAPYAVRLAGLNLVVMDDANAPDQNATPDLITLYQAQFAAVAQLATGPSWLLMHRPIRGIVRVKGLVVGGNQTMLLAKPDLPASVELLLSGHIHTFEAINYGDASPPQLVVGNGGDNLDAAPDDLTGIEVGGLTVTHGASLPGFGFLLLTRSGSGWQGEAYDVGGALRRTCAIAARQIVCDHD
jgi:Calcineurin-like phosphoesterase